MALRDYFQLPSDVKTVDFVHQIDRTATAAHVLKTVQEYQVTPSIARNLDRALDNIGRGLKDRRSIFTWVHGSFGCGKSHFMNMLSLLIADTKVVYDEHAELQEHRQKHSPDVIGGKVFRLHVQCISRQAKTMEELVFGAATEELKRQHPEKPAPALFETQKLFASAKALLDDLGEDKFFAELPSNQAAADDASDDEWGEIGSTWDRARFDAALADPGSSEGRALAGELVQTKWFGGMSAQSEFVRLGQGLQILAQHLKDLGYEGAVLFLDELVLWLSTFRDTKELSQETAKVSTLVEHGDYPPAIPYLTFAARQRDLSQLVGNLAMGRDEIIFRDNLSYWKDRFETISLEDKDLPRIIQKRVLRPTSEDKAKELDRAFATYKSRFDKDFRRLTGDQGDADDFRRVYPFSPALVEVMVALSSTLQRDRTALRELTHLLVNYLPDFELGSVVPVGDLFDVIIHGQTSDLAAIQRLYEQARRIYDNDLLPHIRKKNKTNSHERCQLLREAFDMRLGCAGCQESACRTQTRIAKTVMLKGLVPTTPSLKQLTASSVVYLNSGTLKSVVPNQETSQAAGYIREWAGITPAIHVKGESDPQIQTVLDTVDTKRIINANRELGNVQRCRSRVRDILFETLGIETKNSRSQRSLDWRGRKWRIGVVYDNCRLATEPTFRPAEDEDLRLVVDFPFDERGHGPRDDEERLHCLLEGPPLKTLVWLPSFLSEDLRETLRELVILDGLVDLKDDDLLRRVPFLRPDDMPQARSAMAQQRDFKKVAVENALHAAYGITQRFGDSLAPGMAPERHLYLLVPDAKLTMPAEGDMRRCLESALRWCLQTLAPRHPVFEKAPTRARLKIVLDSIGELVQREGQRMPVDKARGEDLWAIAGAEHLGLVRVVDGEAIFAQGLLGDMAKRLASHSGPLAVGDVRAAIDADGLMWLSSEIEDFLVLAYAAAAPKPLRPTKHGEPVDPQIGKLHNEIALVPVELPPLSEWLKALDNAKMLGVTLGGQALSPARLDELALRIKKTAREILDAGIDDYCRSLIEWFSIVGLEMEPGATQRGEIAERLQRICNTVVPLDSLNVVQTLAKEPWPAQRSSALVVVAGTDRIRSLVRALGSENSKTQLRHGHSLEVKGTFPEVLPQIMSQVREAFQRDENVEPIKPVLDAAVAAITKVLFELTKDNDKAPPPPPYAPPAPEPPAPGPPAPGRTVFILASELDLPKVEAEVKKHFSTGSKVRVEVGPVSAKTLDCTKESS